MRTFVVLALLFCATAAPVSPQSRSLPHATLLCTGHHMQKMSAKRFKRGVHRTAKKVRHFIRRAAGKH